MVVRVQTTSDILVLNVSKAQFKRRTFHWLNTVSLVGCESLLFIGVLLKTPSAGIKIKFGENKYIYKTLR